MNRRALVRIAIIFGAFFVALGGLEVAVRAIPLYPDSFAIPDSTLGWRYLPNASGTWFNVGCPREFTNTVRLNSVGAHDIDHAIAKPAGTQRVLVLGDSLVAALEVPAEAIFFRLLEDRLAGVSETPIEVIGFGVAGYGTAQEMLLYTSEGRAYQPDAVLVLFTPHNDFTDNHPAFMAMSIDWFYTRPYFHVDASGELAADPARDAPMPPVHRFMLERSALYRLLSVKARQYQPPVSLIGAEYEAARAESWAITFAGLSALRHEVESDGARFGVLIDQGHHIAPEELTLLHAEITSGLTERGIASFSLLDAFNAASASGTVVRYPCDSHWTPEGHALAAEAITPFVQSLLSPSA